MTVRTGFLLLATLIMVPSTGSAQWTNRYPMVRGHSHHVYLEGYELPALTAGPIDPAPSPDGTEADFERNKNQLQNFLTKSLRSANDEELAKQSLEWVMYEGHPYRHPVQGTVQGVESITLDDVKAFYHERYTFENLQIGLAGDFPESFPERVREDFKKALPSGATKAAALPKVSCATRGKGLDVTIVERDGADSTAVSLGFPLDITRASDDFYPLLVANIYLGDHRSFNGVLMNELRAKRGLNYGDYSYIENFIQDGGSTFPVPNVPRRQQYFSIWIRPVAPENRAFRSARRDFLLAAPRRRRDVERRLRRDARLHHELFQALGAESRPAARLRARLELLSDGLLHPGDREQTALYDRGGRQPRGEEISRPVGFRCGDGGREHWTSRRGGSREREKPYQLSDTGNGQRGARGGQENRSARASYR